MNWQDKIEVVVIVVTALICIVISILDFVGALDSISWLAQRISIMTLLAIGLVALYLVTERSRRFKNLEESIRTGNERILNKISLDYSNQEMLDEINNIWLEAEHDVQNLFEQTAINTASGNHPTLRQYLEDIESKFLCGEVFGTKVNYPWDFNLAAVNLKGDLIYHRTKELISTRALRKYPYSEILKKRTGTLIWVSDVRSERMHELFPYPFFRALRFTKLYFRELEHLQAIVVFEFHINLLYQLPKI